MSTYQVSKENVRNLVTFLHRLDASCHSLAQELSTCVDLTKSRSLADRLLMERLQRYHYTKCLEMIFGSKVVQEVEDAVQEDLSRG